MTMFHSGLARLALAVACLFPAAAFAQGAPMPSVVTPHQLLTQDERLEYCSEMRNASTPEERQAIARRLHDTLVARAKEQGVTLPPGMRYGMQGMGRGAGMGCGPGGPYAGGAPYAGLQPGQLKTGVEVRHAGDIPYVTGGVGQDETDALRAVVSRYSMRATFASANGDYLSDVAVRVEKTDGSIVFAARSDGRFLFAQLPPGRYRLVATSNRVDRMRMIDVPARGGVSVTLRWPAAPGGTSG
jgi:hypothetical protein